MEFLFIYLILSLLIPTAIVVGIIWLIVKLAKKSPDGKSSRSFGFREAMLSVLMLVGAIVGLSGLFALPYSLVEPYSDGKYSPGVFIIQLVFAVILLIFGGIVGNLTGKYLMLMGVLMLFLASGSAFNSLGNVGPLAAVFLTFFVLIVATIWLGKKGKTDG